MNVTDISLKDLGYVLTVAEHLSFSRAAESCAISQPALSKQIKSLETTLGATLFERDKRQVLLTTFGEQFVIQARRVMEETEQLLQLAQPKNTPMQGLFRLGVIASSGPYLLPCFVGDVPRYYPHLQLFISEGLTEHLVVELKEGKLDAVIAANTFEDPRLDFIPLFFEPFLLAAAKRHYRGQNARISINDVNTSRLLLLEDGHCLKDQTTSLCGMSSRQASQQFKATSVETLLQMTAGGLGISIIPALARPQKSSMADDLVFSELSDADSGRNMSLFFRKPTSQRENMEHLARLIQGSLPDTVRRI